MIIRTDTQRATHTAPSKYHDEIIPLAFIYTKYGEPIVIMGFRRAIQKVLCLIPPTDATRRRLVTSLCFVLLRLANRLLFHVPAMPEPGRSCALLLW
jgi:hypothetical protein